ncbi:hypothetical protein ACFO4E_19540 [Nocardiopsis mangrovi]|uniref:Uncharacterized protein n=1 Tax=Nocardiopsis mangrovi TaxID=1179818 RepID=A0ABV9E1I7_9ACTN
MMATDADPLLALLRLHYSERWTIRRTEHLWIASTADRNADHVPTLIEPDIEIFVRQLEDPPRRVGSAFRSPLSAPWIAQHLTELGDGVFWGDNRQ